MCPCNEHILRFSVAVETGGFKVSKERNPNVHGRLHDLHKSLPRLHERGLIEISADRANYCAVEENPDHYNWEGPHGSSIFSDDFAFIYAPDDKADAFECRKIFDMLLEAIDYADKKDGIV